MLQNLHYEQLENCNNKASVIFNNDEDLLVSYETKIMIYNQKEDKFYLGDYVKRNAISNTTSKHIKAFLNHIGGEYVDKNLKYILKKGNYVYADI